MQAKRLVFMEKKACLEIETTKQFAAVPRKTFYFYWIRYFSHCDYVSVVRVCFEGHVTLKPPGFDAPSFAHAIHKKREIISEDVF